MFPDEVASVVGPVQRKVEIQAIGEAALHERGGRLLGFVSYRACVDTEDLAHCNSPGAIWRRGGSRSSGLISSSANLGANVKAVEF